MEELFARRRDLFSTIDLVFMDTTSLYSSAQTLTGFSNTGRTSIPVVLLDGDGRPVCTEMWSGNPADISSLIPRSTGCASNFRSTGSASSPIAA